MDTNAILDIIHTEQGQHWVDEVNEAYRTGHLCQWVSSFHPNQLPCKLEGTFHHGAFNAGMKMVFSDGTAWMVRFPRGGEVSKNYTDEKVAMEVMALSLIHNKTTIPVPQVQAWGYAASNPLGLGPFIIMDFIDGVSLSDLLKDPNAERPSRVVREDISDGELEFIYRQMANFLLQLFQIDFDRIGSLPSPQGEDEARSPTPPRPLTFKAHSILHNGGVDTFGDRTQGFASTTEYFQYVIEQDWEQLIHQPTSIVGFYDARNKYVAFKVLKSLIGDLVKMEYDCCKFKLICDDLGLANLIVREDLTVVGVVDLEWSYIGPAQLFGSAPWWLLQDKPVNSAWDCESDEELPQIASRYFKCLDIFNRVLEEEEAKIPKLKEERELSSLIKWSQASGAMWLHMLVSSGFNDHRSFPVTQLRRHVGAAEWARREKEVQFDSANEPEEFAARKVSELERYDEALEQMEQARGL